MNNPRNLVLAGAGIAAALYFIPGNIFSTPGTKNIGNAWSRGGGTHDHTPAIATRRGDPDHVEPNQINPKGESGSAGINSEHFREKQAAQRPGDPGPFDKAWNKAHYGTDKGK